MRNRRSSFAWLIAATFMLVQTVHAGDLLNDLKGKATQTLKDAVQPKQAPSQASPPNSATPGPQGTAPNSATPGTQGPAPTPPTSASAAKAEPTIDGVWVFEGGRQLLSIEGDGGFNIMEKDCKLTPPGEQLFKFKSRSPTTFRGQQFVGGSQWMSAAGEAAPDGTLKITTSQGTATLKRYVPPKPAKFVDAAPETASSGTTYYLEYCYIDDRDSRHAGDALVIGVLPANVSVDDWPSEKLSPVSEAYKYAQEAVAYAKKACQPLLDRSSLALTHEKIESAYVNTKTGQPFNWKEFITKRDCAGMGFVKYAEMYYEKVGAPVFSDKVLITINSDYVGNWIYEREQQRAKQSTVAAKAGATHASSERRAAFLSRFGANEVTDLIALYTNPFAYEGKAIALNVSFDGMSSATEAHFRQLSGVDLGAMGAIVAIGVPRSAFKNGANAVLIGKVVGKAELPLGLTALKLKYVAAKLCPAGIEGCF
jgi:hypothetical protein